MQIVPNWCEKCEFDERDGGDEPCVICTVCGDNKPTQFKPKKPPSNADRIRAMTDEELADKLEEIQLKTVKAYGNDDLLLKGELKKYWLDWLKEEVDTNDS